MFNVVSDQLKVSQGWVRCGQCAVVFDASLFLQNGTGSQPELAVSQSQASVVSAAATADPVATLSPGSTKDPIPSVVVDRLLQNVDPLISKGVDSTWIEESAAILRPLDVHLADPLQSEASFEPATRDTAAADASVDEISPDVSFVRDAHRQAFWRKPLVKGVLVLFALALTLLLLLQVAIRQRDTLAVLEPGLKPSLQKLCEMLACKLGPVRQIDAFLIDSSSFNKINDTTYSLSFSIKSTAAIALAMPSLEVTLTDTQDQAVIRRVLTPVQFGMASGLLGASAEFSGALTLQISAGETGSATARRIVGYRLLAFYP